MVTFNVGDFIEDSNNQIFQVVKNSNTKTIVIKNFCGDEFTVDPNKFKYCESEGIIVNSLKLFKILEEKQIDPNINDGCVTSQRLIKYHPISYLILITQCLTLLFLFGFSGFQERYSNPFEWG